LIDLRDAPARNAADAEGEIERDRAGWNGLNFDVRAMLPELHDGSLAKAPLDLSDRQIERFLALARAGPIGEGGGGVAASVCWHASSPVLPSPRYGVCRERRCVGVVATDAERPAGG